MLVTRVLPSADIMTLKPKPDITSTDVVISRRSFHENGGIQLESFTQSNTCFSNGCGYSYKNETANCHLGTYVYQITGYSGTNTPSSGTYFANRFDIVCSDGHTATIGQSGSSTSFSSTIINPQGYTAVLVAGGCITDHIQIGGTDFGETGYGTLSSCSCAPGLRFVGFGTLPYEPSYPSFAAMSIQCDVTCPKGKHYYGGSCHPCPKGNHCDIIFAILIFMKTGTYSFPGSTACKLKIVTNVANGGLFALQVQSYGTFVSSAFQSPAVMAMSGQQLDTSMQFQYLSSTLQIYHPTSDFCLDDGGNEVLGPNSLSAVVSFKACNSSSTNQQFIITTGNQIYNPNWPNNQVCLNGNGNDYNGFQELILWSCSPTDSNEIFNIVPVCARGTFRSCWCSLLNPCSSLPIGSHANPADNISCSPCPAGTYAANVGTIGSCTPCSTGHT